MDHDHDHDHDAGGAPARRRVGAREVLFYLLVVAPAMVSHMASFVLVAGLALGRISGALVGGPLGAALVVVWRNRPGGVAGAEDDGPRRATDELELWVAVMAALADLVVLVLVPLTGRLPLAAAWVAGALLVVHLVLAARISARARERSLDPPPGYDEPAPKGAADLHWRTMPEPLRSAGLVFVVLGFAMIAVAAVSLMTDWMPDDGVFVVVFGGTLLALAVVCGIVALDAGGSAREMARRTQLQRATSSRPLPDRALRRYALGLRLLSGLCAAGIIAGCVFAVVTWE